MFLKRVFDFVTSFLGIILVSPIFMLIALLMKVCMNGPIFFIQKRVGKDNLLFPMIKLRTMKNNHNGNTISVKGDSRITPLGAFLRAYKFDELPELWNVLKGNMSLVGPRPDVPGYADMLEGDDRLLLTVRPGITGASSLLFSNEEELLAGQPDPVKFNDEILWPEKVRINNNYIRKRSFCLDLKIILYTLINKKLTEPWAQSPLATTKKRRQKEPTDYLRET